MGGGDLNMKKHFHPLTRENLERVWKAEQKRDEELKRIEERKKEIAEERARDEILMHATKNGVIQKRQERLDWMYAGCRVNNDDFLLGKEITDEYIEKTAAERKVEIVNRKAGVNQNLPTVDLARKIREDPLFLIKKSEAAATKNIIQNSARIKQIIQSTKRNSMRDSVAKNDPTPRASKLSGAGWETPSSYTRSPSRARDSTRSYRQKLPYKSRSPSRQRHSRSSSNSSENNEAEIQKMIQNAKWRNETRKIKIEEDKKREEIEKDVEERNRKTGNRKSAYSLMDDAKMGNYSSKRYVKR